MRKILSLLAVTLCATACIYPYTPDLEEAPEGILAVDGNISIGDVSTVRLSRLVSLWPSDQNKEYKSFSDAKVWVEDDAGTQYPGVSNIPAYYTDSMWGGWGYNPTFTIHTEDAPDDRRYRLCVEALGERYVSEWSECAPAPVIRKIDFQATDEEVIVVVSVDGGDNGTGYLQLSYDETWEFHTEFYPSYIVDPNSWAISEGTPDGYDNYWCWKSVDSGRIYPVDYSGMTIKGVEAWPLVRFERTSDRNHRKYCVRVKAKTLTKDSYRFLKHLEESTDGGDNLFTPNPGELPGNIRCESDPERQVLGFVTVGRTVWKRAFLDSRYYRYHAPDPAALYYIIPNQYPLFYENGWLPLRENTNQDRDPEQEGDYGWGAPRCYDCVAAGGTKEQPDYWYESE